MYNIESKWGGETCPSHSVPGDTAQRQVFHSDFLNNMHTCFAGLIYVSLLSSHKFIIEMKLEKSPRPHDPCFTHSHTFSFSFLDSAQYDLMIV